MKKKQKRKHLASEKVSVRATSTKMLLLAKVTSTKVILLAKVALCTFLTPCHAETGKKNLTETKT